MSKSRRKLESFREVTKRRKDKKAGPEPWTWKEKLSVWGTIAAVMLLTLTPFVDQTIKHRRLIDRRVERWRSEYHLTEEQFQKLRKIERDYHKSEGPISVSSSHTAAEDDAHAKDIASYMNPDDAKRFLEQESVQVAGRH